MVIQLSVSIILNIVCIASIFLFMLGLIAEYALQIFNLYAFKFEI